MSESDRLLALAGVLMLAAILVYRASSRVGIELREERLRRREAERSLAAQKRANDELLDRINDDASGDGPEADAAGG